MELPLKIFPRMLLVMKYEIIAWKYQLQETRDKQQWVCRGVTKYFKNL